MFCLTLRLRRYLLLAVLITISGVVAGAFAAKVSQYLPKDSPTKYTVQALKMSEGRSHKGQYVQPVVLTASAANLVPLPDFCEDSIPLVTPRAESGESAAPTRLRAPPVSSLS